MRIPPLLDLPSTLYVARTHLASYKVFRPYFRAARVMPELARFPFRYLLGRGRSSPFPLIANYLITSRCNLSCGVCFNQDNPLPAGQELGYDEVVELLKTLAGGKCGLFLSGGEPLLRDDIVEIVEEGKRLGLTMGMVTNGLLLDESRIGRLVRAGIDVLIFSFHGLGTTHDRLVGEEGAFDQAFDNLERIARARSDSVLMVNYILSPGAAEDARGFIRRAAELRIDLVRLENLNFVTPAECEAHRAETERLFPGEEVGHCVYRRELWPEWNASVPELLAERHPVPVRGHPVLSDEEMRAWYTEPFRTHRKCYFIWHSFFLNPDGEIFPCQFMHYRLGNIRRDGLRDVWNSDRFARFRRVLRQGLLPGCSRCCKL